MPVDCTFCDGSAMCLKDLWSRMLGLSRGRWYYLSDEELEALTGNREALVRALQDKYNLTEETARREACRWMRRMNR